MSTGQYSSSWNLSGPWGTQKAFLCLRKAGKSVKFWMIAWYMWWSRSVGLTPTDLWNVRHPPAKKPHGQVGGPQTDKHTHSDTRGWFKVSIWSRIPNMPLVWLRRLALQEKLTVLHGSCQLHTNTHSQIYRYKSTMQSLYLFITANESLNHQINYHLCCFWLQFCLIPDSKWSTPYTKYVDCMI